MSSARGVGASLPRKEDHRLLRGRGEFVADIAMAGTMDVAFVRSPLAHARIRGVTKPPGGEAQVFIAADLAAVRPIVARSGLPGFKVSEQPVLAAGRVRYAGEPIAACLGDTRAAAEDIASRVALDLEELPAVADMLRARAPDAPLLHPTWGDNVFLESNIDRDLGEIERKAAVSVTRTLRTARQCMSPIEGRGVLACWDRRQEMLVLHTACQMPHIVRTGLAQCLGLEQGQVRIVVPDVGGGFGAGSRTAASSSPPTPTAASITTSSPAMPRPTAPCSPSTARRTSTPARTPPTRSPRAWRRRRSRASCPAPTSSKAIGAAPGRWPPASRRSSPIAGWRARACASRSRCCSTQWRASSGWTPSSFA